MNEIQNGIWHWTGQHPDWNERQDWGPLVSSYLVDAGEWLLIIDPVEPPAKLDELVAERKTAVVLTCPWHRRDALALAARLDAPIYVPPADAPDPDPVVGNIFEAGDRLEVGFEALVGREPNDLVLWVPSRGAVIVGDTLMDCGDGLIFPVEDEHMGVPAATILAGLQPLLELPVQVVLPTHGHPTDRAAFERALAERHSAPGRKPST